MGNALIYPGQVRRFGNLAGRSFVIGVGAQKAGTTWLFEYLAKHPDVAMSPIKELHFFDVIHRPDLCAFFSENFRRDAMDCIRQLANGRTASISKLQYLLDRVRMDAEPMAYLEYFDRLATYGRPVVGEITPSYCLLPETGFAVMRDMILGSGAKPRIVFVMRDPVERLWSQCRMQATLSGETRTVDQICDSALQEPGFLERSRYDWTVPRLQESFRTDQLLFLFFEEMFTDNGIRRLCGFLEIDYQPPGTGLQLNASPAAVLDPPRRRQIRQALSPVYSFVAARFGEFVPAAWHPAS